MKRLLWMLCVCAALPVACTAILGDDFEIVPAGSSGQGANGSGATGSGAVGGAGGAGGGAGTEPAPSYSCDWDQPEHRLVATLEAVPGVSFDSLFAARRGPDSVRAVLRHYKSTGVHEIGIFTLDASPNIGTYLFSGQEIHAVERVSASEIGILYTGGTAAAPELHIMIVRDNDPNGANSPDVTLATSSSLPGFNGASLRAAMASVPEGGLDDWSLDVVVGYQHTTTMEYALYYGHYNGVNLPVFTRISNPTPVLNDNDVEPQGMVHFDGTSYAYFGDTGAVLKRVVWPVSPAVTGFVTPTQIAQLQAFIDVEVITDYANVAMFNAGPPIQLLTGAIAGADLGSFAPSDLLVAAEFTSMTDLPFFEADGRWNDDMLTIIGNDADNSIDTVYYFLDNEGRERGTGPLDFTLILPAEENRVGIGDFASALRGDPLDATGGTLHVVWTEHHERNSVLFDVLYYDRLRCIPE